MRINKFVALASGLSRRAADRLADEGEIFINGRPVRAGREVEASDVVTYHGKVLNLPATTQTIMLNKPIGYVCSRNGQGSKTVYNLLPRELHNLKPVGRLDKDSSGLILLTNDGQLAQKLTHPKYNKEKVYEIELDKSLAPEDKKQIEHGIQLEDGVSKLSLSGSDKNWQARMSQGRNRQIRRTFGALDYAVTKLNRTQFGNYRLDGLRPSGFIEV